MSNKLHSKPPRNPIADNFLFPASISISLSCLSLKIKFLRNFWELFDLFCLSYFNCCSELIFYFINFFLFIEQGKSFFLLSLAAEIYFILFLGKGRRKVYEFIECLLAIEADGGKFSQSWDLRLEFSSFYFVAWPLEKLRIFAIALEKVF